MTNKATSNAPSTAVANRIPYYLAADPASSAAYLALKGAGGRVYVVGGAIRDVLAGRKPNDIDLIVAGLPQEAVERALARAGRTSVSGNLVDRVDAEDKRFGVYRLHIGSSVVEVALPRTDKYGESQRGKGIVNVDHNLPIEKDLERRDFTVNSMALFLDGGELIDPYGGARDTYQDILRTTHPNSFREDPTRIIRALAMHGRFGLNPCGQTRTEMESHGHLLSGESPDTINQTLTKGIFGPSNGNPAASLRLAEATGVLQYLFPVAHQYWEYDQNNPHHNYFLGEHHLHTLGNISQLSQDPDLRLAAWLHDWGKPAAMTINPTTGYSRYYEVVDPVTRQISGADHALVGSHLAEGWMRGMNYPYRRIVRVRNLVEHHMFSTFNSPKGARRFLQRVGVHADDLLDLRQADMGGKGTTSTTSVAKMRQLVEGARKERAPTDLQNLAINGNDLIALGIEPGPELGRMLRSLLEDVVEQPALNSPEILRARVLGAISK